MKIQIMQQTEDQVNDLVQPVLAAYPDTQAIYLYGTWGTKCQRRDSDLDIAVLLPHTTARALDCSRWSRLATEVAAVARVEHADLVEPRAVAVLLRKEIIAADRRIYCADGYAADEFEMLTLSFYQELNYERREIVASGLEDGRFYDV